MLSRYFGLGDEVTSAHAQCCSHLWPSKQAINRERYVRALNKII